MKSSLALFCWVVGSQAQDLWCGKVYSAGVPQVIPGGWLSPSETSSPALDIRISPRHSIYVSSEAKGQLIVDARLSYFGDPQEGSPPQSNDLRPRDKEEGTLDITIKINCKTVATGLVTTNSADNLFDVDFEGLVARLDGYQVKLTAAASDGTTYSASTVLFYLPDKTTGSVVKVDYLYGSLLYRNAFTEGNFSYVFPYGFYGNYDGYFKENENIDAYSQRGFNALHPVTSFVDSDMTSQIDKMDDLNLLWQYDMRHSYGNLTSVIEQVPLVKDHPSLLTWYTADEPDGWEDPLNGTRLAYDVLAEMDKYHPVALVLNCQNYYFSDYSAGADIVMEDAYPVGINATWSFHGTACNLTHGDCGCDNCRGSLMDVADRIDSLHAYQSWLAGGVTARKPVWAVPQAFGNESYWSRNPTPQEVWVMDVLAINHGAKGRLAWIYPASSDVSAAASAMARVVTASPVMDFLTQANPVSLKSTSREGRLDASLWEYSQKIMIGVANPDNMAKSSVEITLPVSGLKVVETPWGNATWLVDGNKLVTSGFAALDTSLVLLE